MIKLTKQLIGGTLRLSYGEDESFATNGSWLLRRSALDAESKQNTASLDAARAAYQKQKPGQNPDIDIWMGSIEKVRRLIDDTMRGGVKLREYAWSGWTYEVRLHGKMTVAMLFTWEGDHKHRLFIDQRYGQPLIRKEGGTVWAPRPGRGTNGVVCSPAILGLDVEPPEGPKDMYGMVMGMACDPAWTPLDFGFGKEM